MKLTVAQQFYLDICQPPKVADYRAPHANRGTPPKRHISRIARFAAAYDDDGRVTQVRLPRLFKGHRP